MVRPSPAVGRGKRRDRAQLILITAILVALTVIAAVVLLNVVHDAPGLSAQQEARSVDDTQQVTTQTQSDLDRLFRVRSSVDQTGSEAPYAYEFISPHDDRGFQDVVSQHSESYARLLATNNRASVEIEYVRSTAPNGSMRGSAALQDSGQRFTYPSVAKTNSVFPSGVEADYTILEDATALPRFYVNVTDIDDGDAIEFVIEEDSGSGDKRLTIENTTGGVTVEVGSETYTGFVAPDSTSPIEVDFTDGVGEIRQADTELVGNETFGAGLSAPYTVRVNGGDNATGNYTITAAGDGVDSRIKEEAPPERAQFDVLFVGAVGSVEQGNVAQFQAEVENTDSFEDTQYVTLENESTGRVLDARNITLNGGEDSSFTFTWTPSGNYSGSENFTVRSWTDSDTESVSVNSAGIPTSNYEIVYNSTSSPVQAGGEYTVQVEVENKSNGGYDESQNVSLENFDGNVVNTTTVDPASTEVVNLTWDTPANGTAESGNLTVTTEDDEWVSSEMTLNSTQPFVYDSDMTPSIDQDPIVNPTFRIEYRTPDINYSNRFALYNRTAQ